VADVLSTAQAPPGFGPWADPTGRRRCAERALAAVLFLLVLDVLWSLLGIAAIGGLYAPPHEIWFDHFDTVWAWIGGVYAATFLVAAIAFIRWQRLAIRNTAFLGCERPSPGPALAVFQWFIPFVSLVLPYLSLRATAQWSRPPGRPSADLLLGWWWGAWVASNLGLGIASTVQRVVEGTIPWIVATTVETTSTLLLVAAGVLALKVVRTLTAWQIAKAASLAGGVPARSL